jgi:outer membrane protein, multidrug efflux system
MFDSMTKKSGGAFASGVLAAALAGCAVGPDYKRPAAQLDAAFINAGASATNAQPASADIATFWRGFNDVRLNTLIDRALAANGDIRIAQARLQEARANLGEADAAGLPNVGIDAGVTRGVAPITQLLSMPARPACTARTPQSPPKWRAIT